MPDFTTMHDGGWVFNLEEPQIKPELPTKPTRVTGYLEGPGKWDNYSDDTLYECEVLMRKLLEEKKSDKKWGQHKPTYRKFTAGMMFEVLWGEKYDMYNNTHQTRMRRLTKVMSYYSTRIQKEASILGKYYKKTVYTLSLQRYRKVPPYSLRLRLEWLAEQGKLPCWQNMQLPKDDLKAGHARNKRTDVNMEKRRERARARYNERYADRAR